MADPAVRRQVVEASSVDDEVVRAAQLGCGEGESVTAEEADIDASLASPVVALFDGHGGDVDRIHLEAARGEEQGIAARPAAQVQGPTGSDQALVEIGGQVLVGLRHEERDGLRPVGIEAIPESLPSPVAKRPASDSDANSPSRGRVRPRQCVRSGPLGVPFPWSAIIGAGEGILSSTGVSRRREWVAAGSGQDPEAGLFQGPGEAVGRSACRRCNVAA